MSDDNRMGDIYDDPFTKILKTKDAEIARLKEHIETLRELRELDRKELAAGAEVERLNAWVNDLQSGMYINCVYCGHRYGPQDKVPCSMAEALKKHIEQCPKHPMSALKQDLTTCRKELDAERRKVEKVEELMKRRLEENGPYDYMGLLLKKILTGEG